VHIYEAGRQPVVFQYAPVTFKESFSLANAIQANKRSYVFISLGSVVLLFAALTHCLLRRSRRNAELELAKEVRQNGISMRTFPSEVQESSAAESERTSQNQSQILFGGVPEGMVVDGSEEKDEELE